MRQGVVGARAGRLATGVVNALLVAAALFVVFALVARWFGTRPPPEVIQTGEMMPGIEGIEYGSGVTVVLFLSSECRFCRASVPFYRQLTESAGGRGGALRLVAVTHEPHEAFEDFLTAGALVFDAVIADSPPVEGAPLVPMIIVVEPGGRVAARWVGQLQGEEEQAVLDAVRAATTPPTPALGQPSTPAANLRPDPTPGRQR